MQCLVLVLFIDNCSLLSPLLSFSFPCLTLLSPLFKRCVVSNSARAGLSVCHTILLQFYPLFLTTNETATTYLALKQIIYPHSVGHGGTKMSRVHAVV